MLRTATTTTLARATAISAARITTPLLRRAFTTCQEYTLSYATPLATGSGSSPLRVPKLDQPAEMLSSKIQRSSVSTTHGVRTPMAKRPHVVGLEDTALYLGVLEQRCAVSEALKN